MTTCSCTGTSYWTSTTYAHAYLHSWTWYGDFLDETLSTAKWVTYGVRAVRGG
ncbi:MAG: hypothetical protein ABI080_16495 [Candidatus Binatia bacterium]